MRLTEDFWDDGVELLFSSPPTALDPASVLEFSSRRRLPAGFDQAHERAAASGSVEHWADAFAASGLAGGEGFGERVRSLATEWLGAPTPARRLRLFWLRELWARVEDHDLASTIAAALERDFDMDAALDRAPFSALATLAWVGTLAVEWRGLTVVEMPARWSLNRAKAHLGSQSSWSGSRYEVPTTLTFEGLPGSSRTLGVRKRAAMLPAELIASFRDHFDPPDRTPPDPIGLVEPHRRFLDREVPSLLERLLVNCDAYVVRATDLTCCGSHTILVRGDDVWLAVQRYLYC